MNAQLPLWAHVLVALVGLYLIVTGIRALRRQRQRPADGDASATLEERSE